MTQLRAPRAVAREVLLTAVLIAAALLAGCTRSPGDSHQIGHLAPRTGPDQAEGIRLGEAVAGVVEEFNHDDPKAIEQRPVTVVNGDTGADLDGFTFQATRLLTVNRVVALIGGTDLAQLEKIVSSVQAVNGVLVTPSGGLPGGNSKSVWPVGIYPSERGKYLARYAAGEMKVTEIATICDLSQPLYGAIRDAFAAEFQTAERKIKSDWGFRNAGEMNELSAQVVASAPKAILFCGRARDLLQFRAALRQTNKSEDLQVLFGGEEAEAVFRQDGERSQGIVFSTAFTLDDKSERVQKFATDFRNRCNQPPDVDAALSADGIRVLLNAAKKAQTFKRDALLKELEKLETDCLTGPFWFAKQQGARRTVYIVQMQSGSARLRRAYPPEKK
jgi:ABC-type branched-subunit amino acid transport system substrate-binding protein